MDHTATPNQLLKIHANGMIETADYIKLDYVQTIYQANAPLAQLEERAAVNRKATGSNPVWGVPP